jgi:signal transduction histidine kinase
VASILSQRPARADVLAAAAVAVIAQVETWTTRAYDPKAAYAAAALAMTAPLAWRRLRPVGVLAVVFAPLVILAAAGRELDSAYVMLVLLLAFAAVGAYSERRRAIAGLALGLGLLAAVLVAEITLASGEAQESQPGDFVFLGAILGTVWALAVALRERSLRTGELEERAGQLVRERDERARAAIVEERARIARELHDVVAHSVSVIAVQTGSIRRRLREERPADAEELSAIEHTARQALAEMRRMLGLIRDDDEAVALAPQPGMDQLDRLVEQMRETGLPVDVEVEGERRPLAPGVDLAAFRILQEALTNVLKHAGAAQVRVGVRYGERELELEVTDNGTGTGAEQNGGHGLVGMRERAALYGGSLDAGPRPDGGFAIRACLPTGSA